jgi:hypothetical protein
MEIIKQLQTSVAINAHGHQDGLALHALSCERPQTRKTCMGHVSVLLTYKQ